MSAREAVLKRIRMSLKVTDDENRKRTVAARLTEPPRGVIPARSQVDHDKRIALFVAMAEKAAATTERLASTDAIPQAVARYLRDRNLPAAIRHGDDPILSALTWDGTQLRVGHGAAADSDTAALSRATVGIAETGSLVLLSGRDNPTTLNFMPEAHIVVLRASDIVGDLETAWGRLRHIAGRGRLPRNVNLITGPSRSGDIQQTMLMGAHGPRDLHILVVG